MYCTVEATFIQNNDSRLITQPPMHLNSEPSILSRVTRIHDQLENAYQDVSRAVEKVELSGSSWQLHQVLGVQLITGRYSPLTGAGATYDVMDEFLLGNRFIALLDSGVQNCFMLCVREYFRHKYRVVLSKAHFDTSRNYSEPMKISDVPRFASNNNLSISLYGYDSEKTVYPLLVSDSESDNHIDLLYIYDKHFVLIYDFDSFITSACGSRVRRDRKKFFWLFLCVFYIFVHFYTFCCVIDD